jgi:hypothetical protein
MAEGFLRKVKDAIAGTDKTEQDAVNEQQESLSHDTADQQFGDVRPASEDPYGDPADQQFADVRPASEDPYGDPADPQNA